MIPLRPESRVYIAGCGGMLGDAVYRHFDARTTVKATDIDLNAPWLGYADVRDYQSINESIREFGPELVINLAALTDLEDCERHPENAWLTNALGAENVARVCEDIGAIHVYISTAGIFDGAQEYYNDFDAPNPLGVYAKSKYYGEQYVLQHVSRAFVFRAGWMMGGGPDKDKKFVNKIYQQLASGKRTLHVVDDKLGTPTYTHSFANGIFKVVESGLFGLYNQVCEGDCSRFDVASELVKLLGLQDIVTVERVESDYFRDEYFAPRPASEKLVNMKLNARGINHMPHWRTALAEYVNRFPAITIDEDSSHWNTGAAG